MINLHAVRNSNGVFLLKKLRILDRSIQSYEKEGFYFYLFVYQRISNLVLILHTSSNV